MRCGKLFDVLVKFGTGNVLVHGQQSFPRFDSAMIGLLSRTGFMASTVAEFTRSSIHMFEARMLKFGSPKAP